MAVTRTRRRRTKEERRRDRDAGLDRHGKPLARALGVSPTQLQALAPSLTAEDARQLSDHLRSTLTGST